MRKWNGICSRTRGRSRSEARPWRTRLQKPDVGASPDEKNDQISFLINVLMYFENKFQPEL
jgi:hypothetical protein